MIYLTVDEAKIVILEDALRQAQSTVEFLHNCLTNPSNGKLDGGFVYMYPEFTLKHLKEWDKLVPRSGVCFHSRHDKECSVCIEHEKERAMFYEAHRILGIEK